MWAFEFRSEWLAPVSRAKLVGLAKTGLAAWGGLSFIALGAGLVLHASGAWDALRGAPAGPTEMVSAEPVPARLPRARPDDAPQQLPLMTGSIQTTKQAGPMAARLLEVDQRTATLPEFRRLDAGIPQLIERYAGAGISDAEAVRACEEKVRSGLPHPATLYRSVRNTEIDRGAGDPVVMFDFDALNGLGFPLLQQAQCVFEGSAIARLDILAR